MLKLLKNTKAQAVIGEYVIIFLLVIAAISVMSVYIRRSLQGKIRDARAQQTSIVRNIVRSQAGGFYAGTNMWETYEPYYINRTATSDRGISTTRRLFGSAPTATGATSGIAQTDHGTTITRQALSNVLPPVNAD